MEAALRVMRSNGYQAASVQGILDEAGLSTRAFYRQFRSKDDLLLAMFRTASARDIDAVGKRVGESATAKDAVDAWLDEMVAIAFDRRRIQRMVMFSVAARQTSGYEDEVAHQRSELVAPLVRALERGALDGSFPDTDPLADAHSMFDLVWSVAGPGAQRERPMGRTQAKAHVLRFSVAATGARAAKIGSSDK
jgi:AcrR family transcriptional regulator